MFFSGKQNLAVKGRKKAFVLIVALIITFAVGVATVSLLGLTLQEFRLASRSAAYSRALHAAESAANLACEEFARQIQGDGSAWSGWSLSGNVRSITGNLTNATGAVIASYGASAVSSNSGIYVITSTGRVDLAGATIQRAVQITVEAIIDNDTPRFDYGILSRASIHLSGSVAADSYDSTDATKSTNGQYDPAKACKGATLATLSTADPAIKVNGNAQLDGISQLIVGEGGTVDIAHWIPFTGTISYDAAQEITGVTVPFSQTPSGSIDTGPWKQRYQTITVNGTEEMSLESISVTADGSLTITGSGTLRIYVDGKTKVSGSGSIQISPSPSTADLKVEIYANDDVSIAGSGVLNNTYLAANCSIWGTTNCTSVTVTGNSGFTGTIYAPYAEVDLTGSSIASGAFLGGAVKFSGNTRYYIDESLIGVPLSPPSGGQKLYNLTGWIEL